MFSVVLLRGAVWGSAPVLRVLVRTHFPPPPPPIPRTQLTLPLFFSPLLSGAEI